VVLLTDGPTDLDQQQHQVLAAANVPVDDRRIAALESQDSRLSAITFVDGRRLERDGLLVEAPMRQRSQLAEQLGAAIVASPVAPDATDVDALHRTRMPTVFAAGDVCTKHPHVAGAVASGAEAAMIIVQSLLAADFGLPYPPGSTGLPRPA
jgi:thioredoxin reductase